MLTARFLCLRVGKDLINHDIDVFYNFLMSICPNDQVDSSRQGGSNGTLATLNKKAMRSLMNLPRSSPRQSAACKWIFHKHNLILLYVTPYDGEPRIAERKYAIPFKSAQIRWADKILGMVETNGGAKTWGILELFTLSKIMTARILTSVNSVIERDGWGFYLRDKPKKLRETSLKCLEKYPQRKIASETASYESKWIDRCEKELGPNAEYGDLVVEVLGSCFTTVLSDSVSMHRDVSREENKKRYPFIENKLLFQSSSMSTNDRTGPPLGRGGGGNGCFVFASKYETRARNHHAEMLS